MIKYGANVNAKGTLGRTPLMVAQDNGHKDLAAFLISKGTNVNAQRGAFGRTALSIAQEKGHTEIVELLERAGAKK